MGHLALEPERERVLRQRLPWEGGQGRASPRREQGGAAAEEEVEAAAVRCGIGRASLLRNHRPTVNDRRSFSYSYAIRLIAMLSLSSFCFLVVEITCKFFSDTPKSPSTLLFERDFC